MLRRAREEGSPQAALATVASRATLLRRPNCDKPAAASDPEQMFALGIARRLECRLVVAFDSVDRHRMGAEVQFRHEVACPWEDRKRDQAGDACEDRRCDERGG